MKKRMTILSIALFIVYGAFSDTPVEDGRILFNSRCASCHNVNKVVVGPALAGVTERHTEDWIINFVRSSQTVIKNGDQKAIELFAKFNKIPMPDHPDLTAENIRGILSYIKSEGKVSTDTKVFRPDKIHPAWVPLTSGDYGFFAGYIGLILLLTAALVALVRVKEIQRERMGNDNEP